MSTYAYGGDPTGLTGKYHYGGGGLGVRGALVPSTGDHGPGYIFESLDLPADQDKEYYGLIASIPGGLTLDAGEDSGFTASGADGFYVVPFELIEDTVSIGTSDFTVVFGPLVELTATSTTQGATSGTGAVTVTAPESGAAPRYARPESTVTAGAWLPSSGDDLAAMIDEPSADSTDFISTTAPGACEIALNPVVDPGTSSGQVVRYQVWSPEGDDLLVRLKQGTTIIAAWLHSPLPLTPTIFAQTLTPSECDSITDYTALRFEFTAA